MHNHRLGTYILTMLVVFLFIKTIQDVCSGNRISRRPTQLSINPRKNSSPTKKHNPVNTQEKEEISEHDQAVKEQIEIVRTQLIALLHHAQKTKLKKWRKAKISSHIHILLKQLNAFERKFFSVSPTHVILGPFGALSHMIDEQKLLTQFLVIINDTGALIHEYASIQSRQPRFRKAHAIKRGIANNELLLKKIGIVVEDNNSNYRK